MFKTNKSNMHYVTMLENLIIDNNLESEKMTDTGVEDLLVRYRSKRPTQETSNRCVPIGVVSVTELKYSFNQYA